MFKVGDYVKLNNFKYNDNFYLSKNKTYKIEKITYSINGDIRDFYLCGFLDQVFYHKKFDLDLAYTRSEKIKKLNTIIK